MTIRLRPAGFLAALALGAVTLPAQTPAPQTPEVTSGLIMGRAIDGDSGKPIAGAVITLNMPAAAPVPGQPAVPGALSQFPIRVIADSSGRFVFHDLPKGAFTLSGSKPGYVPTAFGRNTATDTANWSVALGEAERRGDVTLKFWKYASISGRVVDEAGEPVIGIQLKTLRRVTAGGRTMFTLATVNTPFTDDRGAYRIATLLPGDYVVAVVNTQTTVPMSMQEAFVASAGSSATSLDFMREIERSGGALMGLSVAASGQRVGSLMLAPGSGAMTPPPLQGGRVFVYPTTFYPSATSASKATALTVGSGEERTAIDFHIRPVPTSAISGTLIGLNGPESFTVMTLTQAGAGDLQREFDASVAETTTDPSGAFTFLGVTPGAYTIRALKLPPRPVTPSSGSSTVIQVGNSTITSGRGGAAGPPPIPDGPTLWATTTVNVADTNVTGVTVALSAGARLSGRLEFDGSAAKPAEDRLPQVTIQIDSADARSTSLNQLTLGRGVVDATGQFRTYQFPPGRYVVRATGAFPGWSFKSATLGGRDISDTPLDVGREDVGNIVVTFTDHPSELSGTARDSKGVDATVTVLVFPPQQALWLDHGPSPRRFRTARVGPDGVYRLPNMPAGDYIVVAVRTGVPSDWPSPALLQKLAALGTRVSLAEGEKKNVDVETKEVR